MRAGVDPRLERLLGGDHLASLRQRLRRHFERAPLAGVAGSVRLGGLEPDEHAALVLLLGRSPRGSSSLQVDLGSIDAALQQAGIAASLRDALEQLDGPIVHLATARSALQAAWSGVVSACRHPALGALVQTPAGLGLLKRLSAQDSAAAAQLCGRADAVLQRLPAGGMARAQLAAAVLGNAHALDAGQATATLVLAAWRSTEPLPSDDERGAAIELAEDGNAPVADTQPTRIVDERVRDIWARAGVLVNELARPALMLNLPLASGAVFGGAAGEPAYASLRLLLRSPPVWDVAGRDVFVCENPNLVAIAADHWGASCAPLVCTDGMPAAAQRSLLSQLALAGARLLYHGDFDWAGLRIGGGVMREHGALPWRFGAVDYEAAVRVAARPGEALSGGEVASFWDVGLRSAMRARGLVIAEEAVAEALLPDLGAGSQ